MADVLIQGGQRFQTTTPDEVREIIAQARIAERGALLEELRGVKLLRRDAPVTTPALTRITTNDNITPESGYVWAVLMVSAQLASAGTFQAFITSDTDTTKTAAMQRRLVASGASNQYQAIAIPKNACVLLPGEGLFLNAGQNIISYFLSGWEVPAEMQGKLL